MSEMESFPRVLAIQAVIVNEKDQVLLAKRTKEPDIGKWEVIAGYWKPGERLEETVVRQMREKAGVRDYKSIEFTGKYFDDPDRHPGKYCIPFVFQVNVLSNISTDSGESEVSWFDFSELKGLEMALDNKRTLISLGLIVDN